MRFAGLSAVQVLAVGVCTCALMGWLYLLRVRRRTVPVVFAAMWAGVLAEQRSSAWRRRFRKVFSLLVQWATLLALALALGDLRADSRLHPRHWVLLVDASASMGAEDVAPSRLDAAKQLARQVIGQLGPDDRALIAQVDSSVRPLTPMSGDQALLRDALENIEVSHTEALWPMALRFAFDCLQGRAGAEVMVVSDGAVSPWMAQQLRTSLQPRNGPPVRLLPVGVSGQNVAITAFSVRRYPLDRARYEALAEVRNFGSQRVTAELSLWSNGQVLHTEKLHLPAGGSRREVMPQLSGADRRLEARLEVVDSSDALQSDNRAYALLPERQRSRVLVVGPPNTYLDAALLLDEFVEVVRSEPGLPLPEGQFDVTIFDGHAVPRSERLGSLVYLGMPQNGAASPVESAGVIESFGFDRVDRDSPLLRWISTENIQVLRGHRLRAQAGDQVVGASALGPILVAGERQGQRFVALGFDPRDSDLVLRAAWPMFIVNCLQYFDAGVANFLAPLSAGVLWQFPVGKNVLSVEVVSPDGTVAESSVRDGVVYATGKLSGFYAMKASGVGQAFQEQWAVNSPAVVEGNVAPRRELPGSVLPVAGRAVSAAGVRFELWLWMVVAAFAVGCVEWLSFHRRWTE